MKTKAEIMALKKDEIFMNPKETAVRNDHKQFLKRLNDKLNVIQKKFLDAFWKNQINYQPGREHFEAAIKRLIYKMLQKQEIVGRMTSDYYSYDIKDNENYADIYRLVLQK